MFPAKLRIQGMARVSRVVVLIAAVLGSRVAEAQVSTAGFLNLPRPEAPGTLLSHPFDNDSEAIGRTTSLNYLNGWIVVGGEYPGSRPGSDLEMRVYDISDPTQPVRRLPSDFGHDYPCRPGATNCDSWHQGDAGWNAHGTAQVATTLLPEVLRVQEFGGVVERGAWYIDNGVPDIGHFPVGWNRSAQAAPWLATLAWYGDIDGVPPGHENFTETFSLRRSHSVDANFPRDEVLATFDHVGAFGGGDWHPIFFGDLLIYVRSGASGHDGIVVYRLSYDLDDPENRSITPHFVGSLPGGFQAYWPNLFSDGTGLYVVGADTNTLMGADITQATDPSGDGSVRLVANLTIPGISNSTYPVYQDQFGFIQNRKVDMTRFLGGDAQPVVLTLNEGEPNWVDTSQMSLPLGNLWLTGGYPQFPGSPAYRAQGMAVWVQQQAPDTVPPRVSYHIPQANRADYPRHAPLSFLLHEHPRHGGPRNGIDFTVQPVLPDDTLGPWVEGFLILDFAGTLTFTPDEALDPDTTYQVDFHSDPAAQIGFVDAAGNFIEPYSFRFATGAAVNANPPPSFAGLGADHFQPAPGQPVTVSAVATGTEPLEFRFNFDGVWSPWDTASNAQHTFTAAGRPRVLVQVRDAFGQIATDSLRLLVLEPLAAGPRPTQSAALVVGDDAGGRRVWVVNPDADSVAVLDADSGAKVAEHPVCADPRNITRDAFGRYWVTCHDVDEIRVLDGDGSIHATLALPYGAAPFGIAATSDGLTLYATMYGSGQLHRYNAASPHAPPSVRHTFATPRAIAISADGSRVFVTRFLSPELTGEVAEFAGDSPGLDLVRTIPLGVSYVSDGGDRAAGVPNYLAAIALSPDGQRAAVASKQDNVQRGLAFGVADLTHETTVRAVVSFLDLTTGEEILNARRDFDNSDSPSALAYTPNGDTLFVALQGNNRVVGIDALSLAPLLIDAPVLPQHTTLTTPAVIALDLGAGLAPQGVLLDATTGKMFIQNFLGRSVTVRNAVPLLTENRTSLPVVTTTSTVDVEPLPPDVLLGKQIFYNAADPRMSADSYLSCATCHVDGGHDGRTWDFTGRGEGLRRTTDLRGRGGTAHGNVHWSGNFDEIQDFEHDIRGAFGGTGFLPWSAQEFALLHPSPASTKAGMSAELDALAAYVASLANESVPRSPQRQADGSLTPAAVAGRDIFTANGCATCHSGNSFTNSAVSPIDTHPLSDTGTLVHHPSQHWTSGRRLGSILAGIDTPTLHGLHATRTYLHHGHAESLGEVFSFAGGTMLLASEAELYGAAGTAVDDPSQGGGGFIRGMLGGTFVGLSYPADAPTPPGVRFTGVDGGSGGPAQVSLRYTRLYNSGTATLRVNGIEQTFPVLRQHPDTNWHTGGWRWVRLDVSLLPGLTNQIEVEVEQPGDEIGLQLNAVLVANADDLAAAVPHRVATTLATADRANLFAYLQQLDGRDDAGQPLAPPPPTAPLAPSILTPPGDAALTVGASLRLFVAAGGSGPLTFQWHRDDEPIGTNHPFLEIGSVQFEDSGAYTVTVSNGAGQVTSVPAEVSVHPQLSITSAVLPPAFVGVPYSIELEAVGGVSARTWTLVGGILPAGLTLMPDGELAGVAVAPALGASLTIRVSDPSGSAQRTFHLDALPHAGYAPDPDLVLHYTFDEGAGTRIWDAAPAGNDHTTDVPNAQWVEHGRIGGAYGPDNLDADIAWFVPANQADLNFHPRADAFTVSLWARTTSAERWRNLFGKDTAPDTGQYRLWVENPATTLQAITGGQYGPFLPTSAPPINDGNWHLLTLTNRLADDTWLTRLYFDDGSHFVEFATGPVTPVEGLLHIGHTTHGGGPWRGQIDDLRIYRRALEPTEVAALYAAPVPPTYTPTPSTTGTPTATASTEGTPTETPTATATETPTTTPTPSATGTPTATGTASGTPTATETPSGTTCAPQPRIACTLPAAAPGGSLRIDRHPTERSRRDRLDWAWSRGPIVASTDLGDPTVDTAYALCVYDGSGTLVVSLGIPSGHAWRRRGDLALRYQDNSLTHSGVRQISLRASTGPGGSARPGRALFKLSARGGAGNLGSDATGNLPELPEFPLSTEPSPVRAQLLNDEGHCWETRHSVSIKRNRTDRGGTHRFQAAGDAP